MPPQGRLCSNCKAETDGDAVCANCGCLRGTTGDSGSAIARDSTTGVVLNVVFGIVGGAVLAAAVFAAWGFANYLGMGLVAANSAPSPVNCGTQHEFDLYASFGPRIYQVVQIAVTGVVEFLAIRSSIRNTKARRPGVAIAVVMAVLLGLVPATMCDASILYTKC